MPPAGEWRTWLIMAGRGFGKTRAGSELIRARADFDPGVRIALVAASLGEARAVMVEGEAGLLAVCPPRRRPTYEPSLRRLTWPNGAQATLYSAAEPESLRGPQHSHACCPGTKGAVPQRSPRPNRHPVAPKRSRPCERPARIGRGRRLLAHRRLTQRSLDRSRRCHRDLPGRSVAVRQAPARHARVRPPDGPVRALC